MHLHELQGQPVALKILERYLTAPLPPLMIFSGPDGSGRCSAAEAFIQQRLCSVGTGCGTCPSCRKILRGEHPDFIRFPEERIKIGEEEEPDPFTVRWLTATRIRYTPFAGDLRFVLFPRGDLIQHEAETALLKTLEEPPDHTRFIFLVRNLDELKPTVASRGVTIPFQRLPFPVVRSITGLSDSLALELSGGSLHHIPFLVSDLFRQMNEKIADAFRHPLSLIELEKWLATAERKSFYDSVDFQLSHEEFIDFFGMVLLHHSRQNGQAIPIQEAIFEFKEDLHREMAGLLPYLAGRLFHKLSRILHREAQ